MSSTALVEAIIDGVLTGGVYALMAAGLTLIFGVMDIINIAQGVMVILGAYLSYELSVHAGIGLLPGLLITVPLMFLVGVAVEFFFMRRLRDQDRTQMSILVTYAVAIVIEGILTAVFGVDYQQLQASYVNSSIHVFGFYLADIYLIGFGLAIALLIGLYYALYRTKFGRAVRASLQNRTAADLIGIDVNRVRTISVGVGVAVTAVGGMVFGATNSFNPNTGYDLISRLLAIVILGGMGSIGGAMAAAIFLLVINDVVAVAWSPTWAPLVYFAALVLVLSFRPQGLFGRTVARAQ
jgi:branched-chain amino acid transport system permease protein